MTMDNTIIMPKGDYIMKKAVYAISGETRSDRDYPWWIGMTMQFVHINPQYGAVFRYVKDNEGHPYPGAMHTSPVLKVDISDDESKVIVETYNTIYTFEKVKET